MRKMGRIIVCGIMATALIITSQVSAAEASAGIDANQGYVWRGITFNDGFVLQPWVDVNQGGVNINVWGNMDIDDYDGALNSGELSEVDLAISYTHSIGAVELSLGLTEFLYPHQGDTTGALAGTREVTLTASTELCKGLSGSLGVYYDIDEVEDYYANLGFTYTVPLEAPFSMEAKLVAGFAGDDWAAFNSGGIDGGFHDITATLSSSCAVSETISASATVGYTDTLDEDVLPEQDVDVFGGLSLSHSL